MKDKKYLIIGSGISGIAAAKLLNDTSSSDITIYDGNKDIKVSDIKEKVGCEEINVILGELDDSVIKDTDILVISPGVPIDSDIVLRAKELGVTVWGEIELAYRLGKGRVIGITGTNGKTTTTALTGEIMKNYFESTFVVGNIGIPYTGIANETKEDSVIVAEISSFQLESIEEFHPVISAVLNITPDHLNRHYTMENYTKVKMDITKNQNKEEICVLNYEDEILKSEAEKINNRVVFFSSKTLLENGVCLNGEDIVYRENGVETFICKSDAMKLVGIHNIENVMAAAAISYNIGVPVEIIRDTIRDFNAVEHRIEYVTSKNGVVYYNDSKGTNTDASIKAIEAMSKPTILIAGGYDKGSEYEEWFEAFNGKIKKLVLLGATKDKIAATADRLGFKEYILVNTLEEAVIKSSEMAEEGDVVLLSPACASWDMFKSYEERGRLFKDYVNNL